MMSASTAVPDDLARLAMQITEWRSAHPDRHQPLPAALWKEIVPLRQRYPDQHLCRALHVSTHSLRKHGGGPSRHQPHPRPSGPCFVPLVAAPEAPAPAAPFSPTETVIRLALERPDGARLTVQLPVQCHTDLAAVVASLLRV